MQRYRAVALSVSAHLFLLAAIVFHHSNAIDITSELLAHGDATHTYKLIYFPPSVSDEVTSENAKLVFPSRLTKPQPRPQPAKSAPEPQSSATDAEPGEHNSQAGSPLGTITMTNGPITGHEVHVAYPIIYPDPPIERSALPRDLTGDVVIEVTIDSQGNVVETKIVQSIGHGIDEKIEATLRRWHYQPATLDGTPVASRHDVHFHFPS